MGNFTLSHPQAKRANFSFSFSFSFSFFLLHFFFLLLFFPLYKGGARDSVKFDLVSSKKTNTYFSKSSFLAIKSCSRFASSSNRYGFRILTPPSSSTTAFIKSSWFGLKQFKKHKILKMWISRNEYSRKGHRFRAINSLLAFFNCQ